MVGGGLEDAMADLGDRTSDRKEFVVSGERAGHEFAVDRLVQWCA